MKDGKFTDEDIRKLINYGLSENGIDASDISSWKFSSILVSYYCYCDDFKTNYVRGELDTFKKAACLLVAINEKKLVKDKKVNAHIAIDAAEKMCEKPYWNVGPNFDIPYKMEEIDFKNLLENYPDFSDLYLKHRNMLTIALACGEKTSPISIHLNLDLFYRTALMWKKNSLQESCEVDNDVEEEQKKTPIYFDSKEDIVFNDMNDAMAEGINKDRMDNYHLEEEMKEKKKIKFLSLFKK